VNPILKTIFMSAWLVKRMGSHLSTEEEAGRALGGLIIDAKYSGVSGRYFDGFREIPSSVESRDERKASAVWEQSVALAGLPRANPGHFPTSSAASNADIAQNTYHFANDGVHRKPKE
jgi:hypothetical protein